MAGRATDMLVMKGLGFESRQEWRENSLLHGQFSVLTLISVSVPTPCYCRSLARQKFRSFLKKMCCRLQLNTHASYVCGFAE